MVREDKVNMHNSHPTPCLSSSSAFIFGIGKANPAFVSQEAILQAMIAQSPNQTPEQLSWIKGLYQSTAIEQRALVFDVSTKKIEELGDIEQRNKIYIEHAPKLATEAAKQALSEAHCSPSEITHIISASCTGVIVPDVNFMMIEALGLSYDVERVSVNYMGCFAGLTVLKTARALANMNPKNRVLAICTELCGLHANTNNAKQDYVVAMSLFADGSSAVVVGIEPRPHETPIYEIVHTATCAIPNTVEMMAWEMSVAGWTLALSVEIPKQIFKQLPAFMVRMLREAKEHCGDHGLDSIPQEHKDPNFAIHPGGKAIITAISKSLQLTNQQTEASYHVLKNYGNMSGASILFTLDELRKREMIGNGWTVALAFGPGLSVEGTVLKHCNQTLQS